MVESCTTSEEVETDSSSNIMTVLQNLQKPLNKMILGIIKSITRDT